MTELAEIIETDAPVSSFPSCTWERRLALLALAFCLLPFSASARAQAPAAPASFVSIDGLDCVTAYEAEEEPAEVCDDSSNPWNDLNEVLLPAEDKALAPFSSTRHLAARDGCRSSAFSPAPSLFLLRLGQPERSSCHFSLHSHIRERAPPSPA